ncbi:MAG: hypothetical protein HC916_20170 [Coleofasciculaceae cyanobacterium SM2_1_6]|nr:hypothetical protein [Coleofasciculaceae cyanobacterium SM2_1_6]
MEVTIDCATACVNGCVLGEKCPHKEYAAAASNFIKDLSLDQMHEIAAAALRKKMTAPPVWILPED